MLYNKADVFLICFSLLDRKTFQHVDQVRASSSICVLFLSSCREEPGKLILSPGVPLNILLFIGQLVAL